MNIRLVGDEFFHAGARADGRTGMTKLSHFCQFCERA